MSWELVLSVRRWPVSSTARHVGMVIGTHANRMGRAWPSLETVAAETGLDRRTVTRAVIDLERAGLVTVTRRVGQSSEYLFAPVLRLVRDHPAESCPQPPAQSHGPPAQSHGPPAQSHTEELQEEPQEERAELSTSQAVPMPAAVAAIRAKLSR